MKRALLFLAVFGFAIVGCDGDLLVDNTNPNATTEPSMSGLLSNTILSTSNTTQGAASVTSYYVQHLASPSGSSVDRHFESRFGGTWSGIYGLLSDTEALIEKAEAEDSPHYAGVAQIIQAYNLGLATDLWGDIPYQEALQADEGETTPAYDSQEQVYEEIQTLLSDARDNLDAESRSSPGSDDFVYGGDLEKWRKASWALEARYLNHLTKKSDYDPQAVLSAVGNAFERNADDAQMNYENDPSNNPWHNVYLNQEGGILGGHLSEQLVKEMDGSLYGVFDPRLQVAITDSTETEGDDPPLYAGNRNGAGSGDFYNHLEPKYYASEDAPILWITYAEMKFIEAEAALRDGNSGRAYTAYMEGIRAHMDKVGVSESERDAYMNDPAVDVGEDNLTLDEVFKEKNVALFLSPEAWVDHRRHDYDYPDFEPPIDQNPLFQNSQDTDHIRRVLYPLSEIERNRSNVPEVELDQFLWWDQS
jgi:hypothetical protein